jgi:hypothetical protein
MTPITRRNALSACAMMLPLPFLVACGLTSPSATSLDMAKAYADDLANAVSAAANVYLAGPPKPTAANLALVTQLVAGLQQARTALDATTAASDAKGIALQVLAGVQQLVPMVSPFLGAAAPYVPLAIAVVQAFVQSIPPPAEAPPAPPAELHRAGMAYHQHGNG